MILTVRDGINKGMEEKAMFCKKCGKPLVDGARFCPGCGTQQDQQPQTNYGAPPPQNYGTPQGYQQPQANYGAPQPRYDSPPPYNYGRPSGGRPGGSPGGASDKAKNLILLTVILATVGLLVAGIFKGTMFNNECRHYKNRRSSSGYTKYYEPVTMDNWYFAIIKEEGFDDFSNYFYGDTKGMQMATAYTAIAVGAAMAVIIIIAVIIGLAGQCGSAGKLAALAAFLSALPHIMYVALAAYLKSKDFEDVSISFVPICMTAAAFLVGIFCIAASKSMQQTSAPAAGNWR